MLKFAFVLLLLLSSAFADDNKRWWQNSWIKPLGYGAVTAVGTAVAAPYVLGVMGFKAAGIALGSLGAKAMSVAATTGYGMGVVATLQSAGAAGIAWTTAVFAGMAAGAAKAVQEGKAKKS